MNQVCPEVVAGGESKQEKGQRLTGSDSITRTNQVGPMEAGTKGQATVAADGMLYSHRREWPGRIIPALLSERYGYGWGVFAGGAAMEAKSHDSRTGAWKKRPGYGQALVRVLGAHLGVHPMLGLSACPPGTITE